MEDEILKLPSASGVRDEFQKLIFEDLLGPKGGPNEEIDEQNVGDRYLVGMLAPQRSLLDVNEADELPVAGHASEEDGKAEMTEPQTETLIPSSLGLTFSVSAEVTQIKVKACWGRYRRTDSETLTTESGNPQKVWKRTPVEGSRIIELKEGVISSWAPSDEQPDVQVRGAIRKRDNQWIITLFLINGQIEQEKLRDEMWVFQPELIVEDEKDEAIFIRKLQSHDPSRYDPRAYQEERVMAMLFRDQNEFAVGHGVAVHADVSESDSSRATRVSTKFIPAHEVPKQTPPTAEDFPALNNITLDMKVLAETLQNELASKLELLPQAYAAWIEEKKKEISDPDLKEFQGEVKDAIAGCERTLKRIKEGIRLLVDDPKAAESFQFANRAMWLQRIHTLTSEATRRGEKVDGSQIDIPKNRSWYPFQLAFILLNLPGLTNLDHKDRLGGTDAIADLLWFPTGGGKTEAYLGLTAFTLGLRRLQGEIEGRSGHNGVAVLMRYTLRLLTLQQFQRATALICACEKIRREDETKWGKEHFRIGIWVGQRTTPNTTDQSIEAIRMDHGQYRQASLAAGSGSPAQLKTCPWCGKNIDSGRDIEVEPVSGGRGRTLIYCSDRLGECLFSRRQSPGEGIPILVVDDEIYRFLPSLLVATVDKFAQMPWKGQVQMLFGKVNGYCPRHGFRSPEIEDTDAHRKHGNFPAVKTRPHGVLRPPDLIIQDELHLISGPLGTLVGLYETAIDALSSWTVNGHKVYPKIIASTATIRRAAEQVHKLFMRKLEIFPPHGLDAKDNFFSLQRKPSEQFPGRRYIGLCPQGKRIKTNIVRIYVAVLAAAQTLYEKYGRLTDPWMTLVGYFNSMRELGGARRIVDDRVRTMLREIPKRGLSARKRPWIRELTSRIGSTDIPDILDLLEVPFDPEVEKARAEAKGKGERYGLPQPIDVILATNMVSVGVDVKRLGLMVVNGQPKTTSEYIQATSRVGRNFPGLVITLFNWARPRDLSHYERFEHYHATFYQHVEALSVTPFAQRALDRGLSAVMVSLIRLGEFELNSNAKAEDIDKYFALAEEAIKQIYARAQQVEGPVEADNVKQMLMRRLDQWRAQAGRPSGGSRLGYKTSKDGTTLGLLQRPDLRPWELFTCLMSLRDVEPSVKLILEDSVPTHGPADAASKES